MTKTSSQHNYYLRNKRKILERHKRYVELNADRKRKWGIDYLRRLRLSIVAAYGGKCECCGEEREEFLSIDHIYGRGGRHRKSLREKGVGTSLYLWLVRNNFPRDEFRLLCLNCNISRGIRCYCPHSFENLHIVKIEYIKNREDK